MSKIPNLPMADVLLHGKPSDREETLGFPITRYKNVIGSPAVVTETTLKASAPFQLLRTENVDLPVTTIRHLCGNII